MYKASDHHNNLSVLLGKSFALVSGGCAAECCCRSVTRCAASSYCRSFVSRAVEISRSGTLHSPCCTSVAIYPVHKRVTRFLSRKAFTLFVSIFYSYLICGYIWRLSLYIFYLITIEKDLKWAKKTRLIFYIILLIPI